MGGSPVGNQPQTEAAMSRSAVGWAWWKEWLTAKRPYWAVVVVVLALPAVRYLTYDPIADGPRDIYLRTIALAAASAVLVALLLGWQLRPPHLWALAGVVVTLLPGDAAHYARLWQAAGEAREQTIFAEDFPGNRLEPQRWDSALAPGSELTVADSTLRLVTPAGSIGWVQPLLPVGEQRGPPRPWQPAALRDYQPTLTFQWETRFRLAGQYYVLLDAVTRSGRYLMLQARPWDWHLTHPSESGAVAATELPDPGMMDRQWRIIAVTIGPKGTALAVDGREVWTGVPVDPLERVRFGETRTDDLHGGEMELRRLRVIRHRVEAPASWATGAGG